MDSSDEPAAQPINVDEMRRAEIELHELEGADRRYTFYHDETNNIRKLHVGALGLNVAELKVFVLGGVVHEGAPCSIDLEPLRDTLNIQLSAREIKLKHVAKGKFLDALQSTKLTAFLRWLAESDLLIQYQELDPLFWSIVDIVDSVLAGRRNLAHLIPFHLLLKSDLVSLLRADLPAAIRLFHAYGYPSLAAEERTAFLNDLLDLIERNAELIDHFNYMMLRGVIQAGRGLDSLAFIEDNVRHLLIEEFSGSFRHRIILFKNSSHIFDEEESIRERLVATPLASGGAPFINYRFSDSEHEPGIQVADIVVGLLGKMHSYLVDAAAGEVSAARQSLSGPSLENALLLRDLISKSDKTNKAFQQHIASLYDRDKTDRFLRFKDGAYAE
ncbi:MAG: DUF3800 domain-containing protein [Pseudomonadota bacterium]